MAEIRRRHPATDMVLPHEGEMAPSTKDQALQRAPSLASAHFGDLSARIPTFPIDQLPQDLYDVMEIHPMVALAAELKMNVIVSQGFKFVHEDPKVAALLEALWRPHHHAYIRNSIRTGAMRGFCPFEIVYGQGPVSVSYTSTTNESLDAVETSPEEPGPHVNVMEDAWRIEKLKALQPLNVYGITIDGVENFTGFRLVSPPAAELHVEDGSCLLFTHNVRWANFFGEGELRRAYEAWFWQKMVQKYWFRYLGRNASPVPTIYFPEEYESTQDGKSVTAEEIAQEMGKKLMDGDMPYITLPVGKDQKPQDGWMVDFQQLKTEIDFKQAIDYLNAQILRALLMPDSVATSQGLSANRSIGQIHQDSFYAACDGLIAELTEPLDKQVLPMLTRFNFGSGMASPHVQIARLADYRVETARQIAVMAARSGNLPVDWAALTELIDLPVDQTVGKGGMVTDQPTNPDKGTASIDAESQVRNALALETIVGLIDGARSDVVALKRDRQRERLAAI